MLAVSTDDAATLRRFRESLGSRDAFASDAEGSLARLYGVKWPVLKVAGRHTFVIGEGRRVLQVQEGNDAIRPDAAVAACPLRRKKAVAEPPADGGAR